MTRRDLREHKQWLEIETGLICSTNEMLELLETKYEFDEFTSMWEAAEYFEAAYNESENKQQILLAIGIIYAETMHYGTALSLLENYMEENEDKGNMAAIPYLAYCYKKMHDQENYLKYLRKSVAADREITEFLFSEYYPSIQPEEYYLYAFKNAYGRFPESWE